MEYQVEEQDTSVIVAINYSFYLHRSGSIVMAMIVCLLYFCFVMAFTLMERPYLYIFLFFLVSPGLPGNVLHIL